MTRSPESVLALSELYLPVKGGHIVWMHEVCRRLPTVHLLTGAVRGLPRRSKLDGVDLHRIRLRRSPWLRPESAPVYAKLAAHAMYGALRRKPVGILSARAIPEGLVAGWVSRMTRIPSVVFAHGEEIARALHGQGLDGKRAQTARYKYRMLWSAYRGAGRIIANSRHTADLLMQGGIPAERVTVIHPGTDPEAFQPAPPDEGLRNELELGKGPVILTVGRLTPRKGQDTVLRAMPAVLREQPDATYVIAGGGDYRSTLGELATELGVEKHVRFMGEVTEEQLPLLYNLADLFVMPNRCTAQSGNIEGFGIVFLEANACCKPVIGGRSGGVPDAIADGVTGLLVEGDSQDEVASAILRLLNNPTWAQELGRNGRERVTRELTWDHSADRVRELLIPGRDKS